MKVREKFRKRKFLRNKRSYIFLTVLFMGIGFAFLSSNLIITGNTSVSGNRWSIYFTNVQITDGSVEASVVPTTSGTNTTSINYTVTLDKPGDFYEFTVDAVNDGTIDAMVESIATPNIASRVLQYLNYSAKYLDGSDVETNDVLKAKNSTTYKIRIEYRTDIEASNLDNEGVNLDLTFGVNYTQSDIKDSNFAKLVRSSSLSDTAIDFTEVSSASNGEGLYLLSGTENKSHPIYYYRGNVSNNNAKFAGFCWKIVRTTETGGTKLIYNGVPNETTGECDATGTSTQLPTTTAFNTERNSPAYVGYMYGNVYEAKNDMTISESYSYGSDFEFADIDSNISGDGTYTLTNPITDTTQINNHHYTCFNSKGTCSELYYIYFINGTTAYYISLKDGKSVEEALDEMNTNTNNSSIKNVVDSWFNNTFKSYFTTNSKNYNDYLEDTVWCNDRSMNTNTDLNNEYTDFVNNGWKPNGGSVKYDLFYNSYVKTTIGSISLACSNKNDSFTVEEREDGNGALTYPVGLLTAAEMTLAGGTSTRPNKYYYLYTNQGWWAMTPSSYYYDYAGVYQADSSGLAAYNAVEGINGVRPSISIKPNIKIASGGDGSSANPYEFVVE